MIGSRLGQYEVLAKLGEGGMGEVYRARDTKLGRDVAIKVLPSSFASDTDRRVRFGREARLLAALNHPNIATIHGLEDADGVSALVMELVDGPTLAEKLSRGPRGTKSGLPLSDALAIARQIADALAAAHERGIVHRDLKPANLKFTESGAVKVLDFGLAKAFPNDDDAGRSHVPTITNAASQLGGIFGTPAYMSPEQARGQAVDARADIWAFGCVLFEMLTARRAFAGETISDTIAHILERPPDWSALPQATPSNVRRVLTHCLEKDPNRRWRDIRDVRIELDESDEALATDDRGVARRFALGRARGVVGAGADRYRGRGVPCAARAAGGTGTTRNQIRRGVASRDRRRLSPASDLARRPAARGGTEVRATRRVVAATGRVDGRPHAAKYAERVVSLLVAGRDIDRVLC